MKIYLNTLCVSILLIFSACANFVEIEPPRTDLIRSTIFMDDETATAAILDIYHQMSSPIAFASGGVNSISFLSALSADEAVNSFSFLSAVQEFNDNALSPANSWVLSLWTDMYKCIYKANAVIEGLEASSGLTDAVQKQLEGEAKFIRAFCHFYLTNQFGDIPLVLTTNYKVNQNIGRTAPAEVYKQIIADLSDAQALLIPNFSFSNGERTRVNQGAATALLARVYLFVQDWERAEEQASMLLANTSMYSLAALEDVFLKNNREAILQLPPPFGTVADRSSAITYSSMNPGLLNAFEPNDKRNVTWINGNKANKYRANDNTSSEYSVILRLAEQYLIRAEARTHMNNFNGAREDLDKVRLRAGLANTTADAKSSLLAAVEQERRVELFFEWGHRWFDLKRTKRVDAVVGQLKDNWSSTDALYPIPEAQILNDPAMKDAQNPGY